MLQLSHVYHNDNVNAKNMINQTQSYVKNGYTGVDNDVCLRRQKEVGKLTQPKSKRKALRRGKQGLTSCARAVVSEGIESIK